MKSSASLLCVPKSHVVRIEGRILRHGTGTAAARKAVSCARKRVGYGRDSPFGARIALRVGVNIVRALLRPDKCIQSARSMPQTGWNGEDCEEDVRRWLVSVRHG